MPRSRVNLYTPLPLAVIAICSPAQVYVSSLVPNALVRLDEEPVVKETLIKNRGVISVGTCNFRFVYHEDVASPLQEKNGAATPEKVRRRRGGKRI